MRKHSPRKWLHAVLDLLPVLLIPVFMIYSHRHTIDSYQVEYAENKVVDFNQNVKPFLSTNWFNYSYDYNATFNNNYVIFSPRSYTSADIASYVDFQSNDILYLRFSARYTSTVGTFSARFRSVGDQANSFNLTNTFNYCTWRFQIVSPKTVIQFVTTQEVLLKDCNLFNLTQMFGSGNEPTIEQFDNWYSDSYYEYTLSHKELLKGTSIVTYNDTEITSQLTYSLYNTVNNYFNFNNVFNLGGFYDWITLNMFNGNAPLIVPVIWNIIVYEFIMDLLFIFYSFFMFLIDFCECLLEKPFNKIR